MSENDHPSKEHLGPKRLSLPDVVAQSVTKSSGNTQRFVQSLHGMGIDGARELTTLHHVVQQQAYMMATGDMFYMASVTCLVLAAMTRGRARHTATFSHYDVAPPLGNDDDPRFRPAMAMRA